MSQLSEHPTVKRHREKAVTRAAETSSLEATWLREVAVAAGADDVGFVEVDRPEIASEREDIRSLFPEARTLISFVCRMNRENVRSPARSLANLEFHHTGDHVNDVARRIVSALERRGVRAVNPAMGFPMEMDRFPEKIWTVSHKPIAVAAGLGQVGIHRRSPLGSRDADPPPPVVLGGRGRRPRERASRRSTNDSRPSLKSSEANSAFSIDGMLDRRALGRREVRHGGPPSLRLVTAPWAAHPPSW
jgi:hypothetical protein